MSRNATHLRERPMYGVREDYPLLFAETAKYDFAERLGGCTDPLLAEMDAALQEIWDARRNLASVRAAQEVRP